jgi:uncharacterized membrane protein
MGRLLASSVEVRVMSVYIQVLAATCFVLILDAIWLTSMKSSYNAMVQRVQHAPLTVKYIHAVASYICVVLGVVFFAVPLARASGYPKFLAAVLYGGGLGLVVYGVWNFTNLAVFKDYDLVMGMTDLTWGIVLFTLVTYVLLNIKSK